MSTRNVNASGLNPTVNAASRSATDVRRICSALSAPSIAAKPSEYAYRPVKSGAAASALKTRMGQSAESPHSRIAIDANRSVEATDAAKTSGRFPTTAAGR